jgi:hypothetical protein
MGFNFNNYFYQTSYRFLSNFQYLGLRKWADSGSQLQRMQKLITNKNCINEKLLLWKNQESDKLRKTLL